MRWQRPSQELRIKNCVRRRDGWRCVVCGLDEATYKKRYGADLEVHRIVPGSEYEAKWGVCITLCTVCHLALHGKGAWGWITRDDPADEDKLGWWVQRSTRQDVGEEREWRRREVWGTKLQSLRKTRKITLGRLSVETEVSTKTLQDWEAGRCEPVLSEAKRLARALGITMDELSVGEDDSGEWWLEAAEQRSDLRALAFRARAVRDGEKMGRGAALVWELVGIEDDKREQERKAEQERQAAWLRENNAKVAAKLRRSVRSK